MLPPDLAALIRTAADDFAKGETARAFEALVDPARTGGVTPAEIAKTAPPVSVVLFEVALRQALRTPPRLSRDGEFVLIELSDTTHLRFNRIDGRWRLSPRNRPSAETPGIGYDDAPKHAEFLLQKLAAAQSADNLWTESERPVIAALREKGAGAAIGKGANGSPVGVVVLNRTFPGPDELFATLKDLRNLRILAVYESGVSDAGLGTIAQLPLSHLRLIRPTIPAEVMATVGRVPTLRHLGLQSLTRTSLAADPLIDLKSLEICELIGFTFGPDDLAKLKDLPVLRRLDLGDSAVEDPKLTVLAEFPKIESVKLPDAATVETLSAIRSKVPNLFLDR